MNGSLVKVDILEELNQRRGKKRFSLGMLVVFIMLCLTAFIAYPFIKQLAQVQTEVATWTDGLTAQAFGTETWAGTGTETDAYRLASATDLAQLAVNVNAGTTYEGMYFELTESLNLAGKDWVPIGTLEHPFMGTFNGLGHNIYYMTIINANITHAGLFGKIVDSYVTDLVMNNSFIYIENDITEYVGGVVGEAVNSNLNALGNFTPSEKEMGFLTSEISFAHTNFSNFEEWKENIISRANIDTGTLTNTNRTDSSQGTVLNNSSLSSSSTYFGGIVGRFEVNGEKNSKYLQNCANSGTLRGGTGDPCFTGGIVGQAFCKNEGTHISNTDNHLFIKVCANTGDITRGDIAGGIVGEMHADQSGTHSPWIDMDECYSAGEVTANRCDGVLTGNHWKVHSGLGSPHISIGKSKVCYYVTDWNDPFDDVNSSKGPGGNSSNGDGDDVWNATPIGSSSNDPYDKYQYYMAYTPDTPSSKVWTNCKFSTGNWRKRSWSTSGNSTTYYLPTPSNISSNMSKNSNNSITIVTAQEYTVTLNKNGGSGGTSSIVVTEDETVPYISSKPSRSYYTFNGYWTSKTYSNTSDSGTQYWDANGNGLRPYTLGRNTTMYAHWKGYTYYVSYNKNGGSGTTMSTSTMMYGSSYYLRSCTYYRSGYTFAGWATSSSRANAGYIDYYDGDYVSNLTKTQNATVTLYAVWEEITYKITVSASDATTYASSWSGTSGWTTSSKTAYVYVASGDPLNYEVSSLPTPKRTGYDFNGWYYGSSRLSLNSSFSSNRTYTASWTAKKASITLNSQGGTGGTTSTSATYGSTMPSISVPTKTHYNFVGYYTGQNGSGTQYYTSSGTSARTWGEDVTNDTLYAYWQPAPITITFNSNGGSAVSNKTVTLNNTFSTLPIPTREGYRFKNWHYDSSLSASSAVTSSTTLTESMLPGNENSLVLYASWEVLQYNVTLQANEADVSADGWENMTNWTASNKTAYQNFTYGDSFGIMPTPSRAGYTFNGWFTSTSEGTQYKAGDQVKFSQATTLYAQWTAISYTLTINLDGGSIGGSATTVTGIINQTYVVPNATKTGYTFSMWTKTSGEGTISGSTFTFGAGDATITATWTANKYKLTFNKYDSEAVWDNISGFVQEGSNYYLMVTYGQPIGLMPSVKKVGWNFKGWFDSTVGGTQYNENQLYTIAGDRTLFAQFEYNTYTLTIDKNDNKSSLLTISQGYGTTYSLPKVTRDGYIFDKWELTNGEGSLSNGIFTFGEGNALITAMWTPIQYTVKYQGNGSTGGAMADSVFTYDVQSTLRPNAFTREGYQFGGWNTDPTGQGTAYTDGYLVINWTTENGATFTLYAMWESVRYNIIFDGSGGIIQPTEGFEGVTGKNISTATYYYNNQYNVLPLVAKTGYNFLGWFDEEDTQVFESDTVTKSMTLYAKFEAKVFTITLDGLNGVLSQVLGWNYGAENKTASRQIAYDERIGELPNVTLAGHSFKGWFTSADSNQGEQYIASTQYAVENSITLYPHYEINKLTVVFDANGGQTSVSSKVVEFNSNIGTLPVPTRAGYGFGGWAYSTQLDKFATELDIVQDNITLIAQWSPKQFTITFDGNTGTLVAGDGFIINNNKTTKSVYYDAEYGLFPSVTQPGATFVGWFDDPYGNGNQYLSNVKVSITNDITLYAVFKPVTYVVIFNPMGGTTNITSKTYNYDQEYGELPSVTKLGYTLLGWATTEDGTTYVKSTDKVTSDVTLYAIYTANSYTIRFDKNREDATGTMADISVKYGESAVLTKNAFTTLSAEFVGWSTTQNGEGTIYADEQIIADLTSDNGAIITLFAIWRNYEYTVTILSNGGIFTELNGFELWGASARKTYLYNESIGTLPILQIYGYNITSYENAETKEIVDSNTKITENIQIQPITEAKTVTITFNALQGEFENIDGYTLSPDKKTATTTRKFNEEYGVLPTATLLGYQLSGYEKSDDRVSIYSTTRVNYEEDFTIEAVYEPNVYVLIFDADGGQVAFEDYLDNTMNVKIDFNTTLSALPSAERRGYTFDGWYTERNGQGEKITTDTVYKWLDNIVVYAKWIASKYSVSIDPNGGVYEGSTTAVVVGGDYETSVTLSTPTRAGYTFAGFTKTSGGEGILSGDLQTGFSFTFGMSDDTIQAQWTPNKVIINFEYNGATGGADVQSTEVIFDSTYGALPNPTKTDYTFGGWFREAEFINVVVGTDTVKDTEASITLYANWTENIYTLSINPNGGTFDGETTISGIASEEVAINDPQMEGYKFIEWELQSGYVGEIIKGDGTSTFTFGSGNGSLVAKWQANTYTINFDGNNATSGSTSSMTLNYGESYGLNANGYKKTGYTFAGWLFKDTVYADQSSVKNLTSVDGDTLTFVAQWSIIETTLTIDPNGGQYNKQSNVTIISGQYGQEIEILFPTLFGYDFINYTSTQGGELLGNKDDGYKFRFGETNGLITAHWNLKTITITYDPQGAEWVNVEGFNVVDGKIQVQLEFGQTYGDLMPTAENLSKSGFEFRYWVTADGSQISKDTPVGFEVDTTLYADFYKSLLKLSVNPNGGFYNNATSISEYSGEISDVIELLEATRVGYTFDHWELSGEGTINEDNSQYTFGSANATITAIWTANTYTIEFNGNGSSDTMEPITATYDQAIVLTTNTMTNTGYDFDGWNSQANGNGQPYSDNASVMNLTNEANGTVILYAQWKVQRYTINFDGNQGIASITVMNINYGEQYGELPTANREGYTFEGWFTDKESGNKVEATDIVRNSHTLYAHWIANTYTVTFNAGKGLVSASEGFDGEVGGVTTTKEVTFGEQYGALPSATHATQAFMGWYTSEVEGRQIFEDTLYTFAGDQTLYAHYDYTVVNVTFDAKGGELSVHQMRLNLGDPYQFPEVSRVGYKFAGWYLEDQEITEGTIIALAEDHTLTAHWTALTFEVIFNFAGGSYVETEGFTGEVSGTSAKMTITYGQEYGVLPEVYKVGQQFKGWVDENGRDIYSTLTVSVLSGFTATAVYDYIEYNLIVDANGGTYEGLSSMTYTNSYGAQIRLEVPEQYGYNFIGWENTTSYGSVSGTLEEGFTFTFGDGTTTIRAQWEPKTVRVTYQALEGTIEGTGISISPDKKTATKDYTFNTQFGEMPVCVLDGFRFTGWYTEEVDGRQMGSASEISSAEDFTLYAHYEKIEYTLFINSNNGEYEGSTEVLQISGRVEEEVEVSSPTREGYTFDGWTLTGAGELVKDGDIFKYTYGVGNGTLTARWQANVYTVTFDYQGATGGNSKPSIEVTFGSLYGTLPTPTKTGYDFDGWYTEPEGQGQEVTAQQTLVRAENHTLYASWKIQQHTLRVMLDGGSIDGQNEQYIDYTSFYGDTIEFSVPERYGYSFNDFDKKGTTGSYIIEDGKVKFTFGDSDVTLVTLWLANTYTVTFDYQGATSGNTPASIEVTFGQVYGMLPEPEKFGFDFEGWLNDEEQYVIASTPVTLASDHTLVADFKKIASTLTLILDGGELATEDGKMQWKKAFGEQVTLGVPTKEGYEFAGYDHMGGGSMTSSGTGADTLYTFTFDGVDAVITATWRAQTIKVTLQAEGGQVIVDGLEVGPTYEFSVVFGQRYDSIIGNLPTAKKYGYTFNGWLDENGDTIVSSSTVKFSVAHTLIADFTSVNYKLTVDLSGGNIGGETALTITQTAGSTYEFNADPEKTGYDFVDFKVEEGDGDLQFIGDKWVFTFDESDAKIKAYYTPKTFTITFDVNSGDEIIEGSEWEVAGDKQTATKTVTYDELYGELPIATKSGSQFMGWFTQSDIETGLQVTSIASVKILDNIRLYAGWSADQFSLTVELNGGEYNGNSQNIYEQGRADDFFIFDGTFTKTGYTFIDLTLTGEGTLDRSGPNGEWKFTFGAGNAVISCNFEANEIVVKLDAGNGEFNNLYDWNYDEATNTAYKTMHYDDVLGTLPTASLKGNDFSGWFVDATQYTETYQIKWNVAEQTLEAGYKTSQFTLVINPNGGIYNGTSAVTNRKEDYLTTYTVDTPTRVGYTFNGWTEIPETEGEGTLVDNVFTFGADNYTIIANWIAITYEITFEGGASDVQGVMNPQTLTYDVADMLRANEYTRAGYVFAGWEYGGKTYQDKELVQNLTSTDKDELIFTAQWETAIYNIYWDANNGTARPIATKVKYLGRFDEFSGTLPTASREGYELEGWYVGIVDGVPVGDKIEPDTINDVIGDRTLVAYWTIKTYTITLPTLDPNAAELTIADGYDLSVQYNGDFAFKINIKEAYNQSRIRVFANTQELVTIDGVYFVSRIAEDITIIVQDLNINTYVVTFNTLGGSSIAPYSAVPYGSKITPPTEPTRLHYEFVAWYKDAGLTEKFDFDTEQIYEDITLYAEYTKATYTVTFYLTEENPQQYGEVQRVLYLDTATRPADPFIEGYDFIGWYEVGSDTQYDFRSQVTGNINLYGRFDTNTFNIKFMNGTKEIATQRGKYGSKIVPLADSEVKLTGYNFVGWYEDAELTIPFDFENTTITKDMYIYAKYEIIKYTVKFYIDGVEQASVEVEYNNRVSAPTDIEVPEGMHISLWYYNADLTKAYNFSDPVTSDLILYGEYEKDRLNIIFYINDQVTTSNIIYGDTLNNMSTPLPPIPTRTGYTQVAPYFEYVDESGVVWKVVYVEDEISGDKGYYFENEEGQRIAFVDFAVTKELELNAVYTINVYNITFIMPDGTRVVKQAEHGSDLEDLPKIDTEFGDKVVYSQSLENIQGDLTVYVSVENYIKIPMIVVGSILLLVLIIVTTFLIVKSYKKKHDRDKIKELIKK